LDAIHIETGLREVVEVAADDWAMVSRGKETRKLNIRLPNTSESYA
jgi:hypothetical protein